MNLLIINDEKLTAQAMKREIAWHEYEIKEVYLAFDAKEAKEQLKTHSIDIMLCDIEMPGENGINLFRWVKEKNMDVECVFLTCHANFEYAQEAVKLGSMDYVLIPAHYEEIGQAVYKVVQRRSHSLENEKLRRYGEQWINSKKDEARKEQGEKKTKLEIVAECVVYIIKNIEKEGLSVNEVANNLHLSPIYLNRIFKSEKGLSISQFIIKEKMELAARLLRDGSLSANIVAAKVGYSSYQHFFIMFKKYYGCSPNQFKESV